jgi:hypothetical protein
MHANSILYDRTNACTVREVERTLMYQQFCLLSGLPHVRVLTHHMHFQLLIN